MTFDWHDCDRPLRRPPASRMSRLLLLVTIGSGLFVLLLLGCLGYSWWSSRSFPAAGDRCWLADQAGPGFWTPVDQAADYEMIAAAETSLNKYGDLSFFHASYGAWRANGRVLSIRNNTRGEVVDHYRSEACEVRLLDGPHAGRTVVVAIERIQRAPRP
jgi:hypothetical protein